MITANYIQSFEILKVYEPQYVILTPLLNLLEVKILKGIEISHLI